MILSEGSLAPASSGNFSRRPHCVCMAEEEKRGRGMYVHTIKTNKRMG